MVKIPSMDDLKKMGSGLLDQAKSVKLGEMVDKVKTSIESISRKNPPTEINDDTLKMLFQGIFTTLNELAHVQETQVCTIKKLENQLEQLAKIVETYQPVSNPKKEEQHPNE